MIEENCEDEVYDTLMNDFGVEFINRDIRYDELCWPDSNPKIYFDGYVPFNRFDAVTDYLDNVFTGIAILL